MSASPEILRKRLIEVLGLDPLATFNEQTAAAAIKGFCEGSVCARIPHVGGKPYTFEAYFSALYGRKLDGSAILPPREKGARKAAPVS